LRPSIDYVLLTRFNLPSVSVESIIRAKEGWLKDRVALFERHCLPSVLAQSDRNFHWIIYFDPQSPEWLKKWIQVHQSACKFHPMFRSSVSQNDLLSDIAQVTQRRGEELITSNLDNDDGLAVDFVARIKSAPKRGQRTAIYLVNGLVKSQQGKRLYRVADPKNAFCSVRETWRAPLTCWSDYHNMLATAMPVSLERGNPAWLQVVHGRNVSNRIRGRRVWPSLYTTMFPALLDDVAEPQWYELLLDVALAHPLRQVRQRCRGAVRTVALKMLGRDGWTQAKLIARTLPSRILRRRHS
jgi:hypothetical protein